MQANLVMFRESGDRRDFKLTAKTTTVGRKDDCDIRIPLADVSRHHAEFALAADAVVLRDLGSANGTYVNNRRVKKEVKLAAGDHVVIGPVVFTFQLDGEPKEIRAVKTKLRLSSATAKPGPGDSAASDHVYQKQEEIDPISALEALASSADQTAIDHFDDEQELV